MTLTTIGAVRKNLEALQSVCGVYIVRDGSTVLYIGKTEVNPITRRLAQHLGHGIDGCVSPLGELILQHQPKSDFWEIEILTLADCNALLESHGLMRRRNLKTAECALIEFYGPCLNRQSNPNCKPLPKKYR